MRIIGLDLSLAATGVARDEGVETIRYQMARAASELDRVVRLRDLGRLIDRICRDADVVVLEGHSFNSKNTHAHSLGELHGIVKVCLYQRGVPFVPIPPARLKRYATGRGNASKDEVLVAAARRSGHDFRDNNQADAWWLYQMACAAYSHTHRIVVPTRNTEALDGIEWPEIPVRKEAVGG